MVYKAPEGAGGGGGDTSDVEEDTAQAQLSSSDTENVSDEARGKKKLTGKGGKISAATEEMSVYYLM